MTRFKQQITDILAPEEDLSFYRTLVTQYREEHEVSDLDIATALLKLAQGDRPLLMKIKPVSEKHADFDRPPRRLKLASKKEQGRFREVPEDMERFRIEVGHQDGVQPGNIVGAITNEAGLRSKNIGHIKIYTDYSTVDLPKGMPSETFSVLKQCWVSGRQLNISRFGKAVSKEKAKVRRFMKVKAKATRGH